MALINISLLTNGMCHIMIRSINDFIFYCNRYPVRIALTQGDTGGHRGTQGDTGVVYVRLSWYYKPSMVKLRSVVLSNLVLKNNFLNACSCLSAFTACCGCCCC